MQSTSQSSSIDDISNTKYTRKKICPLRTKNVASLFSDNGCVDPHVATIDGGVSKDHSNLSLHTFESVLTKFRALGIAS